MPLPPGKVAPMQVLNFTLSYAKRSSSRSSSKSRREAQQLRQQELRMTPQTAGAYAKRISIENQLSKTQQQRFIDLMS